MTPASTAKPGIFTTTITVNASGKVAGAISNHYAGLSFESGTLNGGHFDAGVKIQGAAVGASGTINPGASTMIKCSSGKCKLTLTPYTAALVTIAG